MSSRTDTDVPVLDSADAERLLREAVMSAASSGRARIKVRPSLAQRLLARVQSARSSLGEGASFARPPAADPLADLGPDNKPQNPGLPANRSLTDDMSIDDVLEIPAPTLLPEHMPYPDVRLVPMPRAAARPAIPDGEGVLSARSIGKSYGGRQVVRDVSLSVRRGEAVGLLGANGAGKTTAFYMITGLVPADKGQIILDGQDITGLPMYRRARLGIGYLPQEASIFRGLNVEDNIRAVLELVEPDKARREQELDALLDEFDIASLRRSPATALSGGERRRLEIARALAGRPAFVLLDEPFAGIDPIAVVDIQELVRQLTSRGIGVLITDHNVRETLGLIDRAYIMHSGQLLMEGTPEEIIASPDVRRSYLGAGFRL